MTDSMTLAFDVAVLEALADPAAVFDDARAWSEYVGVISDKLGYQVVNYIREQGVYNEDFFSRADKGKSLAHVRTQIDTDRYVFVGSSQEDADVARENDWEFLFVDEAAEKADWELVDAKAERNSGSPVN